MSKQHAIWMNADRPASLYAGKVSVAETGVRLDGAGPGGPWVAEIPQREIARVARTDGTERLGDRPWVRLELRNGGTLLIGTVLGAAALGDLLDAFSLLN